MKKRENPGEIIRRIAAHLKENNKDVVKVALKAPLILKNLIEDPDITAAIMLFDTLEVIKTNVDKYRNKSSNSSSFSSVISASSQRRYIKPQMEGGEKNGKTKN